MREMGGDELRNRVLRALDGWMKGGSERFVVLLGSDRVCGM